MIDDEASLALAISLVSVALAAESLAGRSPSIFCLLRVCVSPRNSAS
jgi:hypothetical protein